MQVLEKSARAPSRRSLLKGGLAGGFLLVFHLPVRAVNEPEQLPDNTAGQFAPNAFIRIDHSGKTTLVMPQVEMGQGVYTAVAMILAEELDADYAQVVLEHAPPNDRLYGNPIFGIQVTGNSNSIRAFWMPLRKAGASARAMLLDAAAQGWKVDPSTCTASNGEVVHAATGRKLAYGALVDAASRIPPPQNPTLKNPKDFKIIGRPLKRFDTPKKVDGQAIYGIDAMLPGMKFPGVQKVIVLDDLVAVVGDHMWAAKSGLDALTIDWDHGSNAAVSSDDIWQHLRAASKKDGAVAKSVGDVNKGLSQGDRIEAAYELPFLAHATMEPMNCTIQLKPDSCDIWIGTQIISRVQQTVAKLAGLPVEKVTVHNHLLGGGFGRRLEPDMALVAVRVAQKMNGEPLKVVWTREEDIQHDIYRPVYRDTI